MSVWIKICGITNIEDARVAAKSGADYLGFIFFKDSPRAITPETANGIVNLLKIEFTATTPKFVGVFVNEAVPVIKEVMAYCHLDLVQLSGEEPPDVLEKLGNKVYKAIRPKSIEEAVEQAAKYLPHAPAELHHPALLVDAYHPELRGGTGEEADVAVVNKLKESTSRLMLAGGLTPDNVAEKVRTLKPFAVDVASGVEAEKGKKDHEKVRQFITNVRAVIL